MLAHGINALPVLDGEGRVAGMIGIRDVLRAATLSYRTTPVLRWTRLDEKLAAFRQAAVRRVMARRVVTADEGATLVELAALMANRGVHPIPILRRSRLAGVVGRADVVRALLALSAAEAESAPAAAQ